MSRLPARLLSATGQEALGAIEAQQVVDGLRDGSIGPAEAWLTFVAIVSQYGWRSPTVGAFGREIAKRFAKAGR